VRDPDDESRYNLVPGEYRGVAVTEFHGELEQAALAAHFVGLEAYRRTRFIVVRNGDRTAIIRVYRDAAEPLFAPVTAVELLLGPQDCAFVVCPDVDTAIPTALGRAAMGQAPGKRGVVVQGRYGHISFIIDPRPLRVTVREVVPPHPAKLFDQTRRLLDVAEHLPPIELVLQATDLTDAARSMPSGSYLLPCRGGGVTIDGARTAYLDERPPKDNWTLIGCERSAQIHEWFYGERAEQVDFCPNKAAHIQGAVLTKCCLLERDIAVEEDRVTVPWGASMAQISEALKVLAGAWEPTWAPA
jgi:hypothetical protein